ncbi:MAG: PKD domain-containing protein, partial [uncultured Nocardioidaceae bacterium]
DARSAQGNDAARDRGGDDAGRGTRGGRRGACRREHPVAVRLTDAVRHRRGPARGVPPACCPGPGGPGAARRRPPGGGGAQRPVRPRAAAAAARGRHGLGAQHRPGVLRRSGTDGHRSRGARRGAPPLRRDVLVAQQTRLDEDDLPRLRRAPRERFPVEHRLTDAAAGPDASGVLPRQRSDHVHRDRAGRHPGRLATRQRGLRAVRRRCHHRRPRALRSRAGLRRRSDVRHARAHLAERHGRQRAVRWRLWRRRVHRHLQVRRRRVPARLGVPAEARLGHQVDRRGHQPRGRPQPRSPAPQHLERDLLQRARRLGADHGRVVRATDQRVEPRRVRRRDPRPGRPRGHHPARAVDPSRRPRRHVRGCHHRRLDRPYGDRRRDHRCRPGLVRFPAGLLGPGDGLGAPGTDLTEPRRPAPSALRRRDAPRDEQPGVRRRQPRPGRRARRRRTGHRHRRDHVVRRGGRRRGGRSPHRRVLRLRQPRPLHDHLHRLRRSGARGGRLRAGHPVGRRSSRHRRPDRHPHREHHRRGVGRLRPHRRHRHLRHRLHPCRRHPRLRLRRDHEDHPDHDHRRLHGGDERDRAGHAQQPRLRDSAGGGHEVDADDHRRRCSRRRRLQGRHRDRQRGRRHRRPGRHPHRQHHAEHHRGLRADRWHGHRGHLRHAGGRHADLHCGTDAADRLAVPRRRRPPRARRDRHRRVELPRCGHRAGPGQQLDAHDHRRRRARHRRLRPVPAGRRRGRRHGAGDRRTLRQHAPAGLGRLRPHRRHRECGERLPGQLRHVDLRPGRDRADRRAGCRGRHSAR